MSGKRIWFWPGLCSQVALDPGTSHSLALWASVFLTLRGDARITVYDMSGTFQLSPHYLGRAQPVCSHWIDMPQWSCFWGEMPSIIRMGNWESQGFLKLRKPLCGTLFKAKAKGESHLLEPRALVLLDSALQWPLFDCVVLTWGWVPDRYQEGPTPKIWNT